MPLMSFWIVVPDGRFGSIVISFPVKAKDDMMSSMLGMLVVMVIVTRESVLLFGPPNLLFFLLVKCECS